MSEHKLSVRLYGKKVGVLERLENKKMHFTYKNDALTAISLSMPLKEHVFDHRHCKPFFAGLLPEVNRVRRSLGRVLGIDESDYFGFLKEVGQECAGAISFHDVTAPEIEEKRNLSQAKKLDDKQLRQFIHSIPERSFVQIGEDLRSILSGESEKSQVCLVEDCIALSPEYGLTTHIIKPAMPDKNILFNEYICLKIAKKIGLNAVDVTLRQLDDIDYFLVPRYDRILDRQHQVRCLHQEDFCQALRISPARKMEIDGGPGFKEVFHLLNKTVVPAICRNSLMHRVIFNYLIGNTRAHGKNFSLLYTTLSQPSLAPVYGVRCYYHEDDTSKMAMKIGSKYDYNEITPTDWRQFCKEVNYAYPAFKRILFDLIEKSVSAVQAEKKELQAHKCCLKVANKIEAFVEKQCEKTFKKFQINT